MMRGRSHSRSEVSSRLAGGWRGFAGRAAVLLGLGLASTAVLASDDLRPGTVRPETAQPATMDAETAPSPRLPHVARSLSTGEPLRIVAFGSSSTEGVGASSPANAYPARLEAALRRARPQAAPGIAVTNRGIGGEAVDDMLARLDRDVIAPHPHLVIWQTGSNDPLRGVSLDHFREATLAAVRRIRAAGIDVVLMEPQWCPKLDATPGAYRFRDAVRAVGTELDVPVIRRSDMMQAWIARGALTREQLFSADGLHMADGGYDLLGREAAAAVLRGAGHLHVALAGR